MKGRKVMGWYGRESKQVKVRGWSMGREVRECGIGRSDKKGSREGTVIEERGSEEK